jgi:hypothetical protein
VSNASLVSQYHVVHFPTIVFLSDSGAVLLQKAAAPDNVAEFSRIIDMYR